MLEGKRLIVSVSKWDSGSMFPEATISRVIGEAGEHETEIECILETHGLASSMRPFTASQLNCLPVLP